MASLTQADFGVVLLLAIAAIPIQLWRFRELHRERLKTDRYTLFAARDHWIRLVAEGHLQESDELFQFLYRDINSIIPRAKPLTLRNVVAALQNTQALSDPEFSQKCKNLLGHSDEAVRKATHEYFCALSNILIGRSWFLRLPLYVTHSGIQALSGLRRVLGYVLKTETEAYRLHKQLRSLCSACT